MTRRDYLVMIGLILISGFAGGATTTYLISSNVNAQSSPPAASDVLQVQKLQIVDADGRVRIELSGGERHELKVDRVTFTDQYGNQIDVPENTQVDISGIPELSTKPHIQIHSPQGEIIWKAPLETEAMFVR